jgi:SAM-dependent methyltransferase
MEDRPTTDFGFDEIPAAEKQARVGAVFTSVAQKYDLMNDVMSLGVHHLWKRFTLEMCGLRAGHRVLDLAGGTGDLALRQAQMVGASGQVILADINAAMLQQGRDRLIDKGFVKRFEAVQCNAEILPFADNHFDCITIAFGLRNVDAARVETRRPLMRTRILEANLRATGKTLRFLFFQIVTADGRANCQGPRQLPVSRRIDSHASRSASTPANNTRAGWFRRS